MGDLKMDVNLEKVMKGIGLFIAVSGSVVISYLVILLILGVVADLASSGTIAVHADIATFINTTVTALTGTWLPSLNSGIALIFSLVVLVVVLSVFASFIYFKNKGKSKGGNY